MQALERIEFSNNWITLVFIFGLVLLIILKLLNHRKLFEYSRAFFLKGFIVKKVEERTSFFIGFNIVLYSFSVLIYALFFTYLIEFFSPKIETSFQLYLKVTTIVFGYFTVFKVLDVTLSHLLETRTELALFIAAKLSYSYNTSLFLFPVLIFTTYSFLNIYLLITVFIILFTLSIVLTFLNNKNLIINKLFYFILYLCALEIAPLLIIYKITV
jgi:hypothetical protein